VVMIFQLRQLSAAVGRHSGITTHADDDTPGEEHGRAMFAIKPVLNSQRPPEG
jgi:hypothetical protein